MDSVGINEQVVRTYRFIPTWVGVYLFVKLTNSFVLKYLDYVGVICYHLGNKLININLVYGKK